jgi:hypothetical protein
MGGIDCRTERGSIDYYEKTRDRHGAWSAAGQDFIICHTAYVLQYPAAFV